MITKKLFVFVAILAIASMACSLSVGPQGLNISTNDTPATAVATSEAPVVSNPTVAPTQAPTQGAPAQPTASGTFPLAGSRFPAYSGGYINSSYDVYVEANGRLWQKWLPSCEAGRQDSAVSFELPEGEYIFNGVVAQLYLDVARNGEGDANPMTVGNGNDLHFTVELPAGADYTTAWVKVESDGGCSGGFDIWFQPQ